MKKTFVYALLVAALTLLLSGCSEIGSKTASLSVVYGITAVLSLTLLIGLLCFIRKKEPWFVLLFISVFVVNTGYFVLSVSPSLKWALFANRVSYFGSVFLPLSMVMIVHKVSGINYRKWFKVLLLLISVVVFLIAASPGYLDIYYKSVTLETINGVSVLNKEYGSWHSVYLFYLMGYFGLMTATIVHAMAKKKIESSAHAVILLIAVFVNIAVWLLEQFVKINFEFLAVSYIITELFLIGLYIMLQNQEKILDTLRSQIAADDKTVSHTENGLPKKDTKEYSERCKYLSVHLPTLTATEHIIYNLYLEGKGTKDIMKELDISENTLKYHNKNLYGKLGVSSRKQLIEYSMAVSASSDNQ